jgi:hypothetical protein
VETAPAAVYEPRDPRASSPYALVEDYYEEFERVYDDRYQQQYARWRPVIGKVMRKYLECGDLHRGFARLGCDGCRYQAILAYSCKCRLFCPSCQQKRVLLFAEWLDSHILEQVSHAQFVFTIPKLLRPIFKYHPKELGLLCKSAWQALKEMFQEVATDPSALPGVVISVQSYGDCLNLHPHIHGIASRGVWSADGSFEAIPALDTQQLMLLFRHHVIKNLAAAKRGCCHSWRGFMSRSRPGRRLPPLLETRLGAPHSQSVSCESFDLPQVRRPVASHQLHRQPMCHRKNPATP